MQENRSQPARAFPSGLGPALRRRVAWVCLAALVALAGLDALHQHRLGPSPGTEFQFCRVCQLARTTCGAAVPVGLGQPTRWVIRALVLPAGQHAFSAQPVLDVIRPPPARACV